MVLGECQGHLCGQRDYCADADRGVCNPNLRFCIHDDLRCNSIPNCGPSDHSDENMCRYSISSLVVLGKSNLIARSVTLLLKGIQTDSDWLGLPKLNVTPMCGTVF